MKNLCLGLSLLAGCVSGSPAPPQQACRPFKTGTFRFRFRHPQYGVSFLVTRQGTTQIETNQRTGAVAKLAVTWLDDGTYQLRLLETTAHFPKEVEAYRRSAPLLLPFSAERTGTTSSAPNGNAPTRC